MNGQRLIHTRSLIENFSKKYQTLSIDGTDLPRQRNNSSRRSLSRECCL
jgi:hypothetical protein